MDIIMMAAIISLTVLAVAAAFAGWFRYWSVRKRLREIVELLLDIENGNTYHKLLADPKEDAAEICFCVNRIVAQCNSQVSLLEMKEKAYQKLLTGISHDLRTPLSSMTGYLEAADEHYVPDNKIPEYISVARRKADELKSRVDELFDWFKLNSGEMALNFASEDIYELTRLVAADFITLLNKAKIKCIVTIPDEELQVRLDAQAFARMLGNLLQNVLDHSNADTVEITAGQTLDSVFVSVCDNGRGIDEKDVPYVFDRLYKCDPARTAKSSGLGLSITAALTEAHGGFAEVITTLGKGCTFILHFPVLK